MASSTPPSCYEWSKAKGLPTASECEKGPKGALIPDRNKEHDHIAVVYDQGDTPPEITIKQISGTVHTVLADGIAVAVIADTTGKAPNVADVLLVERRG
ncbi:hypothetical protein ABMC89_05255 [Sulfitobacter sp. HNIBRBA3233]|uniref:hypothetical protein n=1 Tax=Sulfitobacter marinivivus TaxID=3158558 RepID=UPI0032DECA1B